MPRIERLKRQERMAKGKKQKRKERGDRGKLSDLSMTLITWGKTNDGRHYEQTIVTPHAEYHFSQGIPSPPRKVKNYEKRVDKLVRKTLERARSIGRGSFSVEYFVGE